MNQSEGDSSRLARAIQIGLEFRDAGRTDIDAFLHEHADLRDLLEPIVRGEPEPDDDDGRSHAVGRRHAEANRCGPYVLERELGRGGMGTVHVARQPGLDRAVALKLLTAPTLMVSERALVRFQREARMLAKLDHPNIVRVVDTGVHDDRPFLVMDLVRGTSLAEVLVAMRRAGAAPNGAATLRAAWLGAMADGVPFVERTETTAAWHLPDDPVAAVVTLGAEVAEALAHAHQHGIVHRDVKPSNVLVREDGCALLVDFGVARSEGAATLTATGDLAGTPKYMAPEQVRGGAVDGRTDVWALGVTLYEALTLRLPFAGATQVEVVQQLLQGHPVDPRRHNPAVGRNLAAVVLHALAKEAAGRYRTAAEFAVDLRAILDDRPVRARLPGRLERGMRWLRREPWRAMAIAAASAAALAAIVLDQTHAADLRDEARRRQLALTEVERLAIGVRLEQAIAAARAFRWPDLASIPAAHEWIRDHREPLAAELPLLAGLLERLRAEALPYDDVQLQLDRSTHPDAHTLVLLAAELAAIEAVPAAERSPSLVKRHEKLARDEPMLRARVEARRSWRFAAAERQFLHDEVARVVERLREFLGPRGLGHAVEQQAERAAECHRRCIDEATAQWRQVADDVRADPRFGGLRLAPQRDLLPLGKDPASGLWEFVHLPSGRSGQEIPKPRDDGSRALADGNGIVFVLLPGGTFPLGAQADDPDGANFDAAAAPKEGPVQSVTLAPFFVGKFETTRSQWFALTDGEVTGPPTGIRPPGLAPAEAMTQQHAVEVLAAFGLELPTEAQWEYACRAGTTTPWHFGERRLAAKFANFAGTSSPAGAPHDADVEDDGHRHIVAPGTFAPNAFGLYDMHGNVAELTADRFGHLALRHPDARSTGRAPFDELRIVQRGGMNQSRLVDCRASARANLRVTAALPGTGLRAARGVAR